MSICASLKPKTLSNKRCQLRINNINAVDSPLQQIKCQLIEMNMDTLATGTCGKNERMK